MIPATVRGTPAVDAAPGIDALLSLVRSSPECVAAHDKATWLALFAAEHVVEDPVGSRPVRSSDPGALGRFWDALIAPNDIVFEVHHDWVADWRVVRDVTIETTMATGVTITTPAHLLYEVVEEDGGLRLARMAAHWEPAPVFAQLLRPTPANVRSLGGMSLNMLRNLGPAATLQFAGAVRSVGQRGKDVMREAVADQVGELSKVIASGNVVTANAVLDGKPVAVIATIDPRTRSVRELDVYAGLV